MVIKALLDGSLKGVGKFHKTPIFPCSIFQIMNGVNKKPTDANYDLFKLALKSTAKRLYPNYCNVDWSVNEGYDKENPKTYTATMGCLDGQEVVTYLFDKKLYVESFERMWNRMSYAFEIQHQYNEDNPNLYIDLKNVEIYDQKNNFTKVKRIIRNISEDWLDVKFSNGRRLLCTTDHPFGIIDKGVVKACDLTKGDKLFIDKKQYCKNSIDYNPDKAWLLGLILCDGSYKDALVVSIAAKEEDDIEEMFRVRMKECFNLDTKTVLRERGEKGTYKDIYVLQNEYNDLWYLRSYIFEMFGGYRKYDRQIPNEVFSWKRKSKVAFLAGMIDADGYLNSYNNQHTIVQIGSTNKELALQQLALAQSLGMPANLYHNHYTKEKPRAIRYRVEFPINKELIDTIVCEKKLINFEEYAEPKPLEETAIVEKINPANQKCYSYDVTTESEYFNVSGVYSHNCRTYNGADINAEEGVNPQTKDGRGNLAPVTIILPKIAMLSKELANEKYSNPTEQDYKNEFLVLLEQRISDAKDMLLERYEYMCKQSPESAQFMYENHTMLGYKEDEGIESALKHGTLAVGQIGLSETLYILLGCNHLTDKGMEFAKEIEQLFNTKCKEYKKKYSLNFGVYYTPKLSVGA